MDHRVALIAALLAFSSSACWSGYAYPADPPGFQRGGPWGSGFGYSTNAANDQTFGRIVYTPNGPTAPVPGKPTTMPASYRFAQNAPKFAARIIFAHPAVRTAAGIAAWLGMANIVWDEAMKAWKIQGGDGSTVSDGYEYKALLDGANQWHSSPSGACNEGLQILNTIYSGEYVYSLKGFTSNKCSYQWHAVDTPGAKYDQNINIAKKVSSCPSGWYRTQGGLCTQTPQQQPLTEEQFEEALEPRPMPETVPKELPYPSPLPIEPIPWINPEPGPNPQTRPRFVPNGDPVKNPDYDPTAEPSPQNQPFIQPGTRIKPSPTDKDPFRLDMQPVDKPTPTPDPQQDQDEGPGQDSNAKPQENPGLCDQYPDIVACAKLGEAPEAKPVKNEEKILEIKKENGWGPENGTCPAPKTATVAGVALEMSFQPLCDFSTGIRPVIIGLAWISAVFGFLGLSRKD